MSFRENLKNELMFQGILVKELSLKSGINKRTLDNYLREKGNIPPADIAVKIADVLNVSVEYLVTGYSKINPLENSELSAILHKISKLDTAQKRLVTVTLNAMISEMEK